MFSVVLLLPRIVREQLQETLMPLPWTAFVVGANEALYSEKASWSHPLSRMLVVVVVVFHSVSWLEVASQLNTRKELVCPCQPNLREVGLKATRFPAWRISWL